MTGPATEPWRLRLYVAGRTTRSVAAFANLRRICEDHLGEAFEIEVVDLLLHPELAADDEVVALPAVVVRRGPGSSERMVGDLTDIEQVLAGLALHRTAGG